MLALEVLDIIEGWDEAYNLIGYILGFLAFLPSFHQTSPPFS